jgi:hypothetical protein
MKFAQDDHAGWGFFLSILLKIIFFYSRFSLITTLQRKKRKNFRLSEGYKKVLCVGSDNQNQKKKELYYILDSILETTCRL